MARFEWGSRPEIALLYLHDTDGELISAPGVGKQIWIVDLACQITQSGVATANAHVDISNGLAPAADIKYTAWNGLDISLQAPILFGENNPAYVYVTGPDVDVRINAGYYISNMASI